MRKPMKLGLIGLAVLCTEVHAERISLTEDCTPVLGGRAFKNCGGNQEQSHLFKIQDEFELKASFVSQRVEIAYEFDCKASDDLQGFLVIDGNRIAIKRGAYDLIDFKLSKELLHEVEFNWNPRNSVIVYKGCSVEVSAIKRVDFGELDLFVNEMVEEEPIDLVWSQYLLSYEKGNLLACVIQKSSNNGALARYLNKLDLELSLNVNFDTLECKDFRLKPTCDSNLDRPDICSLYKRFENKKLEVLELEAVLKEIEIQGKSKTDFNSEIVSKMLKKLEPSLQFLREIEGIENEI